MAQQGLQSMSKSEVRRQLPLKIGELTVTQDTYFLLAAALECSITQNEWTKCTQYTQLYSNHVMLDLVRKQKCSTVKSILYTLYTF